MLNERAQYEPLAWWVTRERLGQDLRERYGVPEKLPPRLRALVRKLDAVEGKRLSRESSPRLLTLVSKLDAIEGNQLLRACRKRLMRGLG